VKPEASSASRIAPTRPSIMSDGATMSAPASACITACLHSCSMVASLRILPSSTMPSCPLLEYGSSATSVQMTDSGRASLSILTARGTMPSGL